MTPCFGAAKSGRPSENAERIERFAAGRAIVTCDLKVAREYGRLKQRLREKGRPLPENDIWIAATAKLYRMILVTRDRHFQDVEDLRTAGLARSSVTSASRPSAWLPAITEPEALTGPGSGQ